MRLRLLPLAALPLLAAGCLFGGTTHYTVEKSTPCLRKHFKLVPLKTGTTAGLEALVGLTSPGHYVAFYKDEKTAKAERAAFVHRAARSGAAGADTVEQQKNVMIVLQTVDREQDSTILKCLK